MNRLIFILLLTVTLAAPAFAMKSVKMKGRVIGEICAIKGKVGECYLHWANPMVFWTEEDGDFYKVRFAGSELDQMALDKAFGLEVEMVGWIEEGNFNVRKMTVLNPPGKKEFFKG